jgi:hypothetical protein
MTSVPALPPLLGLPQAIEALIKIVGIDPGKRVNPIDGWGEAKQYGHRAAFPQDEFLGVLAASNVTSGFLDATNRHYQGL